MAHLTSDYALQLLAIERRVNQRLREELAKLRTYIIKLETRLGTTIEGVTFNDDNKFDLQLHHSLWDVRRLARVFAYSRIEFIELKSESHQWEQTGNIAIEYRQRGRPSGITVTEADYWVHELKRDGETLVYLVFPIERLKWLCGIAYRRGDYHEGGGDGGQFCNVLLKLSDILQ